MDVWAIIIVSAIGAFLGFAVGRFGDKWGGHINGPHHWILGLILVIVGAFLIGSWFGVLVLSFGLGHFISDLNDFFYVRLWGVDIPHKWKFWDIS